jgi:hypothetical protein
MKGFETTSKILLALAASAALGFAQMSGVPTYPGASQRPGMIPPGTLNYMEGQVSLDGQPLGSQTRGAASAVVLQPGQTLATGNGFAEVLLTPGSFLRVGHNSQIRMTAVGLAETKAQLDRGSAIVEVDQLIQGTNLSVQVNGATAQLEKKGLYDFDADRQAVKVLDGKATVMEAAGSKSVGKDHEIQMASATPLKSRSFDANSVKAEPLYVWSEVRSQDESRANIAVAQNVAAYGGWYGAGWYFDPAWSFYAYLPGNGFLYSPFGWGFYSPAFIGYYGVPFGYYRGGYAAFHGYVGGMSAHVSGFHGGGRR